MNQNLKLATILTLSSAFSYAVIGVIVKHFALTVAAPIVVFITMTISLLLILPIIARSSKVKKQIRHSNTIHIHLIRTAFSLALNYLFYLSLHFLPLVNAVLLFNTAPLMIPFLGFFFFKKKIQNRLWIPVIIGFAGVAAVLHPDGHDFNAASFLALGSAVCMGMSTSLVRFAAERGDDSITTAFFFFLFGTIISGLVSIPFWQDSGLIAYLAIIGAGFLFFIVQITLTYALRYADAQFNNSLYYSNIIFAAVLGMIFFSNYPDPLVWIGIALIIVGGIATIRAQSKINRRAQASL